ncbi:MAG: DoxX family protein, partial [Gemmatimonadaceae bacterium]
GHFSKSPLAGTVGPMFLVITILETAAGVLSGVGCVLIVLLHSTDVAFWGAVLAAVSLIALFFGQRMAKDYAGAATLVPYFLLTLAAIWLMGSI